MTKIRRLSDYFCLSKDTSLLPIEGEGGDSREAENEKIFFKRYTRQIWNKQKPKTHEWQYWSKNSKIT